MKTLRALIVDDEELARRGLEIRLRKFPDVTVVGQSRNGREALAALRETAPDLMFLDVQMPGMDGFEVLKRMPASGLPVVIFVTAYDEFAIRAFDANALDYLLKPINEQRLAVAIRRARLLIDGREATTQRSKLLKFVCELTGRQLTLENALIEAGKGRRRFPARLAVTDGRRTNCIEVDAIDWVDAAGDYMCLHVDGETFVVRGTMKRLEELLDPDKFVRIHRSAIVNRQRVTALRPHRNGEYFVTLDCNHELKLSRKYRASVTRFAQNI